MFITLKVATSIDGKIASCSGHSRWITGEFSRKYVHEMRRRSDAVAVGSGTVRKDNPFLSCRHRKSVSQPLRVVYSASLSIPTDSHVLETENQNTLLFHSCNIDKRSIMPFLHKSKVMLVPIKEDMEGVISIPDSLDVLCYLGIENLLVEGGSKIFASFIKHRHVHRLVVINSPCLIGGDGVPSIGNLGVTGFLHTFSFSLIQSKKIGEDILNIYKPMW